MHDRAEYAGGGAYTENRDEKEGNAWPVYITTVLSSSDYGIINPRNRRRGTFFGRRLVRNRRVKLM